MKKTLFICLIFAALAHAAVVFAWVQPVSRIDVDKASDVFKGKVLSVKIIPVTAPECAKIRPLIGGYEVTFQILRSYKGNIKDKFVYARGGGCGDPMSGSESYDFKVPDEWYVFVFPDARLASGHSDRFVPATDQHRQNLFADLEAMKNEKDKADK